MALMEEGSGTVIKAVSMGDNCIDNYLPPIGQRFVGGNALNVAVYLNRGNIRSAYVGAVGDDGNGRFIIHQLRCEGVDVSHTRVLPGITATTDVAIRGGDRVFVREEFGVVADYVLDEETLDFIAAHALVHVSILGATINHLDQFKNTGMLISFDYSSPDRYNEALLGKTLPLVDFAFFSAPHLRTNDEVTHFARSMHSCGPYVVIVTLGVRGSLAFDGANFYQQPAIKTKVVDTLGAGDAFIGLFLAYQLRGKTIPASLLRAAAGAAKTCSHLGAWLPNPVNSVMG